jgi:hypothetical protein
MRERNSGAILCRNTLPVLGPRQTMLPLSDVIKRFICDEGLSCGSRVGERVGSPWFAGEESQPKNSSMHDGSVGGGVCKIAIEPIEPGTQHLLIGLNTSINDMRETM